MSGWRLVWLGCMMNVSYDNLYGFGTWWRMIAGMTVMVDFTVTQHFRQEDWDEFIILQEGLLGVHDEIED